MSGGVDVERKESDAPIQPLREGCGGMVRVYTYTHIHTHTITPNTLGGMAAGACAVLHRGALNTTETSSSDANPTKLLINLVFSISVGQQPSIFI